MDFAKRRSVIWQKLAKLFFFNFTHQYKNNTDVWIFTTKDSNRIAKNDANTWSWYVFKASLSGNVPHTSNSYPMFSNLNHFLKTLQLKCKVHYRIHGLFMDGILNPEVVPTFSSHLRVMETQFFFNLSFFSNLDHSLRPLILLF